VINKETEIDSVVEAVVEGLILSVCQSLPGGGDAPEGSPAPTLVVDTETTSTEAVDEDGPKGDCAAKAAMDKVSQPAMGCPSYRSYSPRGAQHLHKKMRFMPRHNAARRLCRLRGTSSCAAGITPVSNHPTRSPNVFLTSAPLAGCETLPVTAFATQSPFGPSSPTASVDVVSVRLA